MNSCEVTYNKQLFKESLGYYATLHGKGSKFCQIAEFFQLQPKVTFSILYKMDTDIW